MKTNKKSSNTYIAKSILQVSPPLSPFLLKSTVYNSRSVVVSKVLCAYLRLYRSHSQHAFLHPMDRTSDSFTVILDLIKFTIVIWI